MQRIIRFFGLFRLAVRLVFHAPPRSAGKLPVGVETRGDEDAPCWPQMNNATYKEVWTTPAARWLAVVADLMG